MAQIHRKKPIIKKRMTKFHAKPTTKSKAKKIASAVGKGLLSGGKAAFKGLKKTADYLSAPKTQKKISKFRKWAGKQGSRSSKNLGGW